MNVGVLEHFLQRFLNFSVNWHFSSAYIELIIPYDIFTAAPVIEIFGMDIYGGTIFIRWSYSNPTDDVKVRLKMTIMENENMICQYVVDAENLYTVQNGTFDPSVDYYVQVEILEGTFQRTMLPVLQFPTEQSSIMRSKFFCTVRGPLTH